MRYLGMFLGLIPRAQPSGFSPGGSFNLLLESGDDLLLEDGFFLALEP